MTFMKFIGSPKWFSWYDKQWKSNDEAQTLFETSWWSLGWCLWWPKKWPESRPGEAWQMGCLEKLWKTTEDKTVGGVSTQGCPYLIFGLNIFERLKDIRLRTILNFSKGEREHKGIEIAKLSKEKPVWEFLIQRYSHPYWHIAGPHRGKNLPCRPCPWSPVVPWPTRQTDADGVVSPQLSMKNLKKIQCRIIVIHVFFYSYQY